MRRIVVHIDSLVLRGFRHEDRHAIAEGLRAELGRQFAEGNAAQHLVSRGDVSRLRVSGVRIEPGSRHSQVGVQAARGIAREIES